MDEQEKSIFTKKTASAREAFAVIDRLFELTKPDAIYTEPITSGEYMVILASELVTSMGAGYGEGGNQNPAAIENNPEESGYGGGGGGGGFAMSRPVAAITIGPKRTRVDPIVDPTKISIAFFTTFTAMIIALIQVFRFKRR